MSDERAAEQAAGKARAPRARRGRGAMESLLTIVHGLEVAGLVFGALAVWGVTRSWQGPLAFALVAVLLILAVPVLKHPWGWIPSLVLQAAVAALTAFEPVWGVAAVVLIGLWVYCFVKSRQIQAQRRAHGLDPYGPPPA